MCINILMTIFNEDFCVNFLLQQKALLLEWEINLWCTVNSRDQSQELTKKLFKAES